MVEASGPRSLSGGEEQVPAARARSACGDRQRCPFPIHFPWPGIRRATQQGGTRARGGQLRPAPPRTPRAARARAARQEAPGTQGREGSRAGRDVGSATRVWPASGDTRRPPLGPALARTSGRKRLVSQQLSGAEEPPPFCCFPPCVRPPGGRAEEAGGSRRPGEAQTPGHFDSTLST
nr:atherin-like isoform X2 [Manis javanica]